ncbi:SusD/RagB family nutrient-binding outer membrane lipoprotein [Flammeovirgaceae bacterium SG7u.111]|nr:SusD/RagB family nutrient-binding outer membrane lipoprotein [Flammeovirgaceae bacterium SG7u.132]WPO38550.1 SusD/RagB family nutrient-binding outer membrane lipoprotein [Flammeovirgaceae bacterium SG7u.111]
MKKYIVFISLFTLMLFSTSCDEFKAGIDNIDPDVATADAVANSPELILTGVLRDPVTEMVSSAWSEGNLMAQYGARIVFTSFDQFEWGSQSGAWTNLYTSIRNAKNLEAVAVESGNTSYEAVSLIMQAWMFQILTDMWGDVPMTEAIKGKEKNFAPVYDTQEVIYDDILAMLLKANDLLADPSAPGIRGDILLDGDLDKWRKFANSLRLRVALRLSEAKPATAESVIKQIMGDLTKYPVLESNDDNITLTFLTNKPNAVPFSETDGYRSGSFNEYRMAENIQSALQDRNDTRIQAWFNPTSNSVEEGTPKWDGMANGLVDGDAYVYKGGDAYLSKFADKFFFEPNTIQGMLIKYDEVQFILAEAAQRGWIAGDAKTFYEEGIKASFDYWKTEMPAGYLEQANVAYDGELETIMIQKWISLINTDYQGFIEFKRTGFPSSIKPGRDAFLPNYPSRFQYPTEEQSLNTENYNAVLSRQGADVVETKVWWEK